MILNAEGQPKTPSLVHFDDDETLVGESVESLIQDVSTDASRREEIFRRTIVSIKRNLLSPPRIALPGGRYVRPVEVAAAILKKMKRDAEDGHFHEPILRAVITCPAEFNVLQRQKISEAGRLAGFSEIEILEEPVAGALAYARAGLDVGEHVLVYDLGGGTFDLAVLDSDDDSFHVAMEPKGMERCGGEDFDLALYHHCDEIARASLDRPISLTQAVDLSFLRACRRRKESLTFQESGRFNHYLSSTNGPVRFEHEVDRLTFESLISEYIETTTRLTKEILNQADSAGHEVDTVVLIGGSVRVPLVVNTLEKTLPVTPLGFDKRDVAVALGAAHYADNLWNDPPTTRPRKGRNASAPAWMKRYETALEEVRDGELNRAETNRLREFARGIGASPEEAEKLEVKLLGGSLEDLLTARYRRASKMIGANNTPSVAEIEWLGFVARDCGLNDSEASAIETEVMGESKEALAARRAAEEKTPNRADFSVAHTLLGHTGRVEAAEFGGDGRFIISGGSDLDLHGWNALSGESVGALVGHTGRVNAVSFSPDGKFIVSGGSDGSVRLWRLPDGEPYRTMKQPAWVLDVAVDRKNGLIASGGTDGKVRLWNPRSGQIERTLTGHEHWVSSVAFGRDGRTLASGSPDGTVRLWNLETAQTKLTLKHPGRVTSLAASTDFRRLVSGCGDGLLRLWDTGTGQVILAVAGHSGGVSSVDMSLDGRTVFSGGEDGGVGVWDSETGVPLCVMSGHRGRVSAVSVAPDGESFLSCGGAEIKVWKRTSTSHSELTPRTDVSPRTAAPPPDLPS